uniref:Uncharacterized protein n=1 Tax=Arundo donax TaxID=35708 RepID=A0A0A9G0A6_ARUDO
MMHSKSWLDCQPLVVLRQHRPLLQRMH